MVVAVIDTLAALWPLPRECRPGPNRVLGTDMTAAHTEDKGKQWQEQTEEEHRIQGMAAATMDRLGFVVLKLGKLQS